MVPATFFVCFKVTALPTGSSISCSHVDLSESEGFLSDLDKIC